jgi:hypothetical protein
MRTPNHLVPFVCVVTCTQSAAIEPTCVSSTCPATDARDDDGYLEGLAKALSSDQWACFKGGRPGCGQHLLEAIEGRWERRKQGGRDADTDGRISAPRRGGSTGRSGPWPLDLGKAAPTSPSARRCVSRHISPWQTCGALDSEVPLNTGELARYTWHARQRASLRPDERC